MRTVTIIALETAMASSVSITIDVLSVANRICEAAGRPHPFAIRIEGSGADMFRPFLTFPESTHDRADIVIVPGQLYKGAGTPFARMQDQDVCKACQIIRTAYDKGADLLSSCTGTILLAREGLLDGRLATAAWWLAPAMAKAFPKIRLDAASLIATDGRITTAGAAMAQMDLMVMTVARYAGPKVADACLRWMLLDRRQSQTPYMALDLLAASSASVSRAVAWARPRLDKPLSVNEIAGAAGQSPRTFARRVAEATGMSPVQLLQRLRLERAVELLESSDIPFEEISYRVGYTDTTTLRRIIRDVTGLNPRDIRARAAESRRWQSTFAPQKPTAVAADARS